MSGLSYRMLANGDAGLSVIFNHPLSERLSRQIHWLANYVKSHGAGQVVDVIPAYQSLTVHFSPGAEQHNYWYKLLNDTLSQPLPLDDYSSQLIDIPVCYEGPYGPDLNHVAKACGLSEAEVVTLHCSSEYLVHMLGFAPGFLYLGGLPDVLHCPRKSTPTLRVAPGSVGIGGSQTGIYPYASPGGWQLIGRSPIRLFNPQAAQSCLLKPLDKVRFYPISQQQFKHLSEQHEH